MNLECLFSRVLEEVAEVWINFTELMKDKDLMTKSLKCSITPKSALKIECTQISIVQLKR